jgi:23S rRNA pseudouridine2605 synthase
MAKHAFEKFEKKEPTGAKKKELIKQEKRKLKKEARAAGEEFRRKKREERYGTTQYNNDGRNIKYQRREGNSDVLKAKREERGRKNEAIEKQEGLRPRKYQKTGVVKPITRKPKNEENWLEKPSRAVTAPRKIARGPEDNKPAVEATFGRSPKPGYTANKRAVTKAKSEENHRRPADKKRQIKRPVNKASRDWQKPDDAPKATLRKQAEKSGALKPSKIPETSNLKLETIEMPLNKYISHAGVCARREAAALVKQGNVTVNGSVIYEPGFKVTGADKVLVKDKQIFLQHNPVYILLNKPKDYLTTAKDPEGRKTVFDLVANATKERVFPVGRLDRNTTGVLLLTNDGELAQKLTHPSYEIRKIYEVKLDKDLNKKDFEAVLEGVTLEDGFVAADSLAYADAKDKSIIGIEIHSGRNRIVRRIFEHLGYDVKGLDRVMFANLTKKNVDRGKYRILGEKEVRLLKFMNQSFVRKGQDLSKGTPVQKDELIAD